MQNELRIVNERKQPGPQLSRTAEQAVSASREVANDQVDPEAHYLLNLMKSCSSTVAPLIGIVTLIVCDYAFIFLNQLWGRLPLLSLAMIIVYNILSVLAVTSQLTAWYSEPGYISLTKD